MPLVRFCQKMKMRIHQKSCLNLAAVLFVMFSMGQPTTWAKRGRLSSRQSHARRGSPARFDTACCPSVGQAHTEKDHAECLERLAGRLNPTVTQAVCAATLGATPLALTRLSGPGHRCSVEEGKGKSTEEYRQSGWW